MVPRLAPFQKRSLFPLQFGQEESISGNSIERRVYWFILKIGRVLIVPTGRVGLGWWTLIIFKIAPSLENSLENKSMLLVHFKKDLPLTLLGHSFDRTAAYWLLFCFELPRYSLFLHGQSKHRTVNTMLMIRLNSWQITHFYLTRKKQNPGLYLQ